MPSELSFNEFPSSTWSQWLEQLKKDLKLDDPGSILTAREESLSIPVYRTAEHSGRGISLFHRAARSEGESPNSWDACVTIDTGDLLQCNRQILAALNHGAGSIRLTGHEISNQEELNLVLREVMPHIIRLNFDCGEATPTLLFMYAEEVLKRGQDSTEYNGAFSFDPLGDFAFTGSFSHSLSESLAMLKAMIRYQITALPSYKSLSVNALAWHSLGAGAVQELAYIFSALSDYFDSLSKEIPVSQLAATVQVRIAPGAHYFMGIAKLRALRQMWALFLQGYGLDAAQYPLHVSAETSFRNKTIYDPYNNLLRLSTESMAAVIAGCDELTLHPHDAVYTTPGDDSRRLALNIHHLLRYEARLDKVLDPAAGAWYIETLSADVFDAAWELFVRLEQKGGFVKSLEDNVIQDQVAASRKELEKNIRSRKRVLVGVSSFARPEEKGKEALPEKRDPLQKAPSIRIMEPVREAAYFEQLRFNLSNEGKPLAYLCMFGDTRKSKARADFAADFVACAGFAAHYGDSSVSPADQMYSKAATEAQLIVLCAADEDYLAAVEQIFESGNLDKPVWVAGRPAEIERMKALGVDEFIYLGCDTALVWREFEERGLVSR